MNTVSRIFSVMQPIFSLEQLAAQVQHWCQQHGVVPATGQAAELLTERTVRYYRTIGLLDAPVGGAGKRFTEKHRLQLVAVRLLQAQGLGLRRIRELLYGRSLEELQEIEARGVQEIEQADPFKIEARRAEAWTAMPLDEEFVLVSRQGRALPQYLLRRLTGVIKDWEAAGARGLARAQLGKGEDK